jgi:hypothetical protein
MNDLSLINIIGFDRKAFEFFFFERCYVVNSGPGKKGRPRKFLDKKSVLAMILHFYCSETEYKTLCEIFSVPPATLSRTLQQAEKALLKCLNLIPEAVIKWPSKEEQILFASWVEQKYPLLKGRWGFIDGKNFKIKKPSASEIQNAFYNGWLHSHFVTGTLCYAADGTVVWGKHNYVGSWNDGETSRDFQLMLLNPDINVEGHGVIADSAFPVSGNLEGKIVTPMKQTDIDRLDDTDLAHALRLDNLIKSCRQAAEWGMGSAPKVFRQLEIPLPLDPKIRARRIANINKLYNMRVRLMGISEILNVFRPVSM